MRRWRRNADRSFRELERLYRSGSLDLRGRRTYLVRRWEVEGQIPEPCDWLGELSPTRVWEEGATYFSVKRDIEIRPGLEAEAPWLVHLGSADALVHTRGPFRGGWTSLTDAIAAGICASPSGPEAFVTVFARTGPIFGAGPQGLERGSQHQAGELWESQWVAEHDPDPPPQTVRRKRSKKKWRQNVDLSLRRLERRAAQTGDPEDVSRWAMAVLHTRPRLPREDALVLAYPLLANEDQDWGLMDLGPGFVLVHPLPFGRTLTVSNDPDHLGYEGGAVGWLSTPLVHFRTAGPGGAGGGGVLHPDVIGGGMGSPEAIAEAATLLLNADARLLGALTLQADEGLQPRVGWDWDETPHDMRNSLLWAAGLGWPRSRARPAELDDLPLAQIAAIDKVRAAVYRNEQLIYPVSAFRYFPWVPFPEVLRELGFHDDSYGNDAAGRAAREVGGPERGSSPAQPWIEWHGAWPELEDEQDNYELSVWAHGLHEDDREVTGARYDVVLNNSYRSMGSVEIGQAQNEHALRMILLNLGLRPEGA